VPSNRPRNVLSKPISTVAIHSNDVVRPALSQLCMHVSGTGPKGWVGSTMNDRAVLSKRETASGVAQTYILEPASKSGVLQQPAVCEFRPTVQRTRMVFPDFSCSYALLKPSVAWTHTPPHVSPQFKRRHWVRSPGNPAASSRLVKA